MTLGELLSQAEVMFQRVAGPLNVFVVALIILLSGTIIGRIVDRMLFKLLPLVGFDEGCARLFGSRRNYARALRRSTVFLIYGVTVYLALDQLSLTRITLFALLGLVSIIVLLSVVLFLVEIPSGLRVRATLRREGISTGDVVDIGDPSGQLTGKVIGLTLTEIRLQRGNGDTIFYPLIGLRTAKITKR